MSTPNGASAPGPPPGDQPWDAPPGAAPVDLASQQVPQYGVPPAYTAPQYGAPPAYSAPTQGPGPGAEVTPAEGGFIARERPGMGLGLVILGSLVALVTVFLTWCEAVPSFDSDAPLKRLSPFELRDGLADLGGQKLPALLTPWLLLGVTAVAAAAAVAATVGLRSRARTTLARVAAWLIGQGGSTAYLVVLIASVDNASEPFVGYTGTTEYLQVRFVVPVSVWGIALAAVAWSALIGPRIVWAAGPLAPAGARLRVRVHVAAAVFAWLAAACVAIAFLAVPWFSAGGQTSTFAEVADAINASGSDLPLAQAYFGGVGYLVIVAVLAAAALLTLGAVGSVSRVMARTVGGLVGVAGLGLHIAAVSELDAESSAWSAGLYLVPAGLGILLLGVLLTARVTVWLPGSAVRAQ